ncbi:hypothetical protein [Flavobacterium silvaticum]|uniref:Uncharacterized protein n=1 Tax=Flavobacterium silvaticum TaxID=1852020 RepID=A0A972FPL1_9FLAO|nr:hypothetical protein [Flavobacterium silvaticum]NMH29050.1 hypothetical protein [Flavobacterium silvaticum]
MKRIALACLLLFSATLFAQKPCEWSANGKDSLGTYKALKDYVVYESNFGSSSTYVFLSLQVQNEIPYLHFQYIKKSKDFIAANCFDKNSRLFLQLDNGVIVTLKHIDQQSCGQTLMDSGFNSLISEGTFVFMNGTIEDLKSSPVSLLRVRYSTETFDYPMASQIKSELTKETYFPQKYFIDYLSCILP